MFIDALIGGLGGIISRTCVAPIELNRIQRQNYFIPNANLTDVYKKEGMRFFWKGNGVNCIRIFPQIGINYSVFRQSKNTLKNSFENKNTVNFVSGCFAGCVSMISTYPLETTRTYLSLQTNKNNEISKIKNSIITRASHRRVCIVRYCIRRGTHLYKYNKIMRLCNRI